MRHKNLNGMLDSEPLLTWRYWNTGPIFEWGLRIRWLYWLHCGFTGGCSCFRNIHKGFGGDGHQVSNLGFRDKNILC